MIHDNTLEPQNDFRGLKIKLVRREIFKIMPVQGMKTQSTPE